MSGNDRGLSLIELIVTMTILAILAAAVLPLTSVTSKRMKEMELRRNLRVIRTAIDDCKRTYDDLAKQSKLQLGAVGATKSGCPETLKALVDGIDFGTSPDGKANKKKFLRRIPADPFNPPKAGEEPEWGMRSYTDESDTSSWGGEDVYDVYSLSEETALDGSKYKDW